MAKNCISLLIALFTATLLHAQSDYWPKEIPLKTGGKILIYQPQPDELNGIILKGRAAVGGKEKANDPMVYGAIFFEATLITDKKSRMAILERINITNAKLEGIDDTTEIKKMIDFLENEIPKFRLDLSIDQIIATIERNSGDGNMYNNNPPKVIYRQKPTTLVILDGEPKVKKDKNLDAERVLNSPNLIFKEGKTWKMYNGGIWYKSSAITSGWVRDTKMSAKVKSINEQIKKQEKEANNGKAPTEKPVVTDILVSTEPAELIQTKGVPQYKSIEGTTLQYVSNTQNDIFKTADGTLFILVTGRWFKSTSLDGPWTFNGSDKMPKEFAEIPEGSEKDNVLVSISGTPAAEEAIIEAEIPQTAKIDRKKAKVEVEYDGNPVFERIEGTSLELAENSNLTILKEASGNYFALDNGVWFVGNTAKGPWIVSEKRPEGLDEIPPSSPAYNAKFVYIYEVEEDYIISGYTGGYLGTFVQGDPVIIFGTGYYYRPWFGSIYYPRPTTWGFNFSYNPWSGWTMGFGFNFGFLHIGFSSWPGYGYGGGWFGPSYYRPPYYRPYYGGGYYGRRPGGNNNIIINGNVNIGNNNIYNRPGSGNGYRPGISSRPYNNTRPGTSYKPGYTNTSSRPSGSNTRPATKPGANTRPAPSYKPGYDNSTAKPSGNNTRPATNPGANTRPATNPGANTRPATNPGANTRLPDNNRASNWGNRPSARPSTNNKNNVFVDRDGRVYQRDNGGNINTRDNRARTWRPADRSSPSYNNVRRDAQARDRSYNRRPSNYQRPQPRPSRRPASRPSPSSGARRRY